MCCACARARACARACACVCAYVRVRVRIAMPRSLAQLTLTWHKLTHAGKYTYLHMHTPTHATMCFIKHDITCGIFCFRFGLSVTGMVHPKLILTNANARVGDVLVLTKPIGTGVLTTAMKRGLASQVSY